MELSTELKTSINKIKKFSKFAGKGACWTAAYGTFPLLADLIRQKNNKKKKMLIPSLLVVSTIGLNMYQLINLEDPFSLETNIVDYETKLGVKISSKQDLFTIQGIGSIYEFSKSMGYSNLFKDSAVASYGIFSALLSPLGTYHLFNSEGKYNRFKQTTTLDYSSEKTISYKAPNKYNINSEKFDLTCEFRKHETTESYSLRTLKDDLMDYSNSITKINGQITTNPRLENMCQELLSGNQDAIFLEHHKQK